MAKKSRRSRKKGRRARLSSTQMVRPITEANAPPHVSVAQRRPVVRTTDLRDEYRYVVADLKRIGVIALTMLVVLVALALLLP